MKKKVVLCYERVGLLAKDTRLLAKTDYDYALMSTSGFSTGIVSNDTLVPRIDIHRDILIFADPNGGNSSYLKYDEMMLYGSITCSGIITSGGWQVVTYGQVTTRTKANLGDDDLILVLNS
ncbi:MAG: hypothetical protein J6U10_07780 [Lachnospiraceae bacterium]|nr:hypothetical protein [Lachnospiraceae bacterium]